MTDASLVELGLFVGAIALSTTYCIVKCLAQVEQSRCVEIDCCCNAVRLRRAVEAKSTVIDVAAPNAPPPFTGCPRTATAGATHPTHDGDAEGTSL
jgi:hypothetical protein